MSETLPTTKNKYLILHGDCFDRMIEMADNGDMVDAIVTDPPYGLSFMGKKWDKGVPSSEIWKRCLSILKPGGHLLCFAGTRTQHRMASAIEDAGFEIRDTIAWVYGSGFPKSHDVGKAIDKAAGAEREVVGQRKKLQSYGANDIYGDGPDKGGVQDITAPATEAAKQWQGWGTALKPAFEPITVARKPLVGTVAANVLAHGTGGINVDGCRVDAGGEKTGSNGAVGLTPERGWNENSLPRSVNREQSTTQGRWPANLIHDGSDEVTRLFPVTGGRSGAPAITKRERNKGCFNSSPGEGVDAIDNYGDSGSAARFFYCAKAGKRDRDEGCEGMPLGDAPGSKRSQPAEGRQNALGEPRRNHHPTVKPTDLMRYLCRLVTPPGGIVLDPFMGSGSTGKAAILEGFRFVGIELDPEYIEIARARMVHADKLLEDSLLKGS